MVSSEKENLKLQEPLGKADLIGRPEMWPGQLASHAIPKAHELWLHSHPSGINSENTGHLPANQGTDLLFLLHRPHPPPYPPEEQLHLNKLARLR